MGIVLTSLLRLLVESQNTTSSGMNSVPGVLTRNRAQSQSQATRDADTMPNS